MAERVTIIGAGIVGICTAISLIERGVSVLLIDRNGEQEIHFEDFTTKQSKWNKQSNEENIL